MSRARELSKAGSLQQKISGFSTHVGMSTFAAAVDMLGALTVGGAIDANGGATVDNIQIGITGNNEIDTSSGNLTIDSAGGTVTIDDAVGVNGILTVTGNILPEANGTRDLGANGTRWANVYSSDLDLSNQAKGGNSVDGTWGSFLVEEGEDHLYLTNRRSGKKYRFMLEEV